MLAANGMTICKNITANARFDDHDAFSLGLSLFYSKYRIIGKEKGPRDARSFG
jgi:hypothetical protein